MDGMKHICSGGMSGERIVNEIYKAISVLNTRLKILRKGYVKHDGTLA